MPTVSGAPKPPYLIFGFDVDSAHPNAKAIVAEVEEGFPIEQDIDSLGGIDNMFIVHVNKNEALEHLSAVEVYFTKKAADYGGVLRWAVQLCRVDELAQS